jgi:hypothetical protein
VIFPRPAVSIFASPDGSCVVAAFNHEGAGTLRAYHWSNFGSSEGIPLDIGTLPLNSAVLSSMVTRSNVHFVGLDLPRHECRSVALLITRKNTEFSFQEMKNSLKSVPMRTLTTAHNCLIDCHAEVWTRFPVVPAIRRKAVKTSSGLQPRALVLASNAESDCFQTYWNNLIATFERNTHKPTEQELASIRVLAASHQSWRSEIEGIVSDFLAGEWLVDILCLIPIHLAVARDNSFVPLKDGVLSANLGQALLGASISQIVDAISIGWYESIFSSYMSSKVFTRF